MKRGVFYLFTVLIIACNTTNTEETNDLVSFEDSLNAMTKVAIIEEPKQHKAAFTLREYFFLLEDRAELFYGLSDSTRALIWNAGRVTPSHAHFDYEGDMGNGSLDMLLLKNIDSLPILALVEQIERSNQITFWTYNKEENRLEQNFDVLPQLDPNMFVELNIDLPKDIAPMVFMAEDSLTLRAELYTWMNPAFEEINVNYDLLLRWNGEQFDIKKDTILQ